MERLLPLLREYGRLERKRIDEGVTPVEYQRWLELEKILSKQLCVGAGPGGIERRRHMRVPTRMLARFASPAQLKEAVVRNISRGGLYIDAPLVAEIGARFVLRIRIDSSGSEVDVPCEVVSRNAGVEGAPGRSGMGLKFTTLSADQREAVDRLFAEALGQQLDSAFWQD